MAVAFDEMNGPGGELRPAYQELSRWLKETPAEALEYRRQEAELLFRRIGITFAVYGDAEAQERLIPFDVIPRIISAREWGLLEKGLTQRVRALNMFLSDIYHGRDILRAGIIPDDLIFQNPVFRPEMNGQDVPHGVYVHIAGIDIVRVLYWPALPADPAVVSDVCERRDNAGEVDVSFTGKPTTGIRNVNQPQTVGDRLDAIDGIDVFAGTVIGIDHGRDAGCADEAAPVRSERGLDQEVGLIPVERFDDDREGEIGDPLPNFVDCGKE